MMFTDWVGEETSRVSLYVENYAAEAPYAPPPNFTPNFTPDFKFLMLF